MDKKRVPRLSLDLLRGFHAAARHLSFTRAASELFVTQPAISREVKTLEAQLGQRLFRRANRTLQLTPAGEELYRCADEVFALIDSTVRRLSGSPHSLGVTAPVPFASLWLGPRLPQFTQLHPEIDLRVAASNDVDNLERSQLDVAIRFMPHGKAAPDGGEWVADYKTFPICSPALATGKERPLTRREDLATHVLIDFETIIDGRRWSDWEKWRDELHVPIPKSAQVLRFSHYDQVIQAVVKDAGIAIGKWPHLAGELERGTIAAPFGHDCVASIGNLFAITSARAQSNDAAAAFVSWLKIELGRDTEQMPRTLRDGAGKR